MSTEHRVTTGRGGAGNVATIKDAPSPKLVPQGSQTPVLLQPVYSTGRGGAGNMRPNVDPQLTRRAQDVDGDDILHDDRLSRSRSTQSEHQGLPARACSIGRGGAGNILSPTNSQPCAEKKPMAVFSRLRKRLFG
ncbi:ADR291Cp [Eremothecium gossypii ATCC 10895]|uniref:ADR291Cp n=1 Tax=Eremothecium gossypii (strain ATCC 10895 / CBS 109.51 / FGSC 9923 / NRRL Y-1056) TaxID=284811 RepID=Q759I6_EREGS|nr:ADR291Cp [Eremothecium gossypii ATCC 10895]AAS52211.1 ADR291Cp [Eremothecium gossypii ATCC 10895]AEY96510.1 FADR291Cp [Eremothecium gossypii FDAG1]